MEPIFIGREEFLRHHGWTEGKRGWSKIRGTGKPLPTDGAFEIETILQSLDNEVEFNPDYVSNRPRSDRLGRPLPTIAQAAALYRRGDHK